MKALSTVRLAAALASVPVLSFAVMACSPSAASLLADLPIGKPAPEFRATDPNGRDVALSDFRGKTVVLEWNNPECPFTKKHYESGNMQRSQAVATAGGIVWLTINSSAQGKQGHLTPAEARALIAADQSRRTFYLLDPEGMVGKSWGAKTTPHLFVVDPSGTLVYRGAIDDRPTASKDDISGARNHVLAALAELKQGKPVSVPTTSPYGCGVKY